MNPWIKYNYQEIDARFIYECKYPDWIYYMRKSDTNEMSENENSRKKKPTRKYEYANEQKKKYERIGFIAANSSAFAVWLNNIA